MLQRHAKRARVFFHARFGSPEEQLVRRLLRSCVVIALWMCDRVFGSYEERLLALYCATYSTREFSQQPVVRPTQPRAAELKMTGSGYFGP